MTDISYLGWKAGYTHATKKSSWSSISCLWEGLVSFPAEAVSVLVTPHPYRAHSRKWELPMGDSSASSLMSAGEQNESWSRTPISPLWAVQYIKMSGSLDRCRPCRCLHLIRALSFVSDIILGLQICVRKRRPGVYSALQCCCHVFFCMCLSGNWWYKFKQNCMCF